MEVLELSEVIRCTLFCMLEVMRRALRMLEAEEGGLCLLEVL